jgi:hypothetical protein
MVDLLRKHFVAFALDNASVPNVTPAEALWLKDRGGRACTQGMTVFTAGGQLLGTGGGYQAAGNIKMLKDALTRYRPEEKVEIGGPDAAVPADESGVRGYPRKVPRPVKDGLVLFVSWKVLRLLLGGWLHQTLASTRQQDDGQAYDQHEHPEGDHGIDQPADRLQSLEVLLLHLGSLPASFRVWEQKRVQEAYKQFPHIVPPLPARLGATKSTASSGQEHGAGCRHQKG